MKLIVFGATGSVGSHLVFQALEQGYQVSAFTRNPEKLKISNHPALTIIKGDIYNPGEVEQSLHDQQIVLCAIGDGNKGKVRTAGTNNIIQAMKKNGIRRIICQTTLGLGDSRGNLNFVWKRIMFGFLLRKAFQDHAWQEKLLTESGLDYTIVRPSAFKDGNITREYQVAFDGNFKKLRLKINRADVADFMLQQLRSEQFMRRAVSISN